MPNAEPFARHHARHKLGQLHLGGNGDVIGLIVCELVTNAVRACAERTQGVPYMRLWLCSDCERVLVQIWDDANPMPAWQDSELDVKGNRGLLLVDSLSAKWGACRPEVLSGKLVWVMVTGGER